MSTMQDSAPHFVVITAGTTGDLHPFISVACALQRLGRRVTFMTSSYHAPMARALGLTAIDVGTDDDYLRIIANPDLWNPTKGFAAIMSDYRSAIAQMYDELKALQERAGAAPLIVIAHPFAVPAAAIARERGVVQSVVGTYLAPSNFRSYADPLQIGQIAVPRWAPMWWRRTLWRIAEKNWLDPAALPEVNAVRAPLGLPNVTSFLSHIAESPDISLTLFPEWFAATPSDWPQPLLMGDFQLFEASTGYDFSPELSAFLNAGDAPIVVTAGTGNIHAAALFATVLDGVQRLGRRVIFLSKERAQIPAQLPASVLWQSYVPLSALLPHAAALIHHGGIGTTAEALRAGAPQLITPFAWDQFDNGARVTALGVGRALPAKGLKARALTRTLHTLLTSESIQARCAQVAAHFSTPHDPSALCAELEQRVFADLTPTFSRST